MRTWIQIRLACLGIVLPVVVADAQELSAGDERALSPMTSTIHSPHRDRRETWEIPPGWTETVGGAGGRIFRVTTLAARGPGSLAEALEAKEARVIEFAVAGIIDLDGRSLRVDSPYATLAGETAPSPGVTLVNGGLQIRTHDVVVRHLRIRPGGRLEADALSVSGAHDVIIDHCSLQWATDENLSASGPRFRGDSPEEWRKNTSHRVTFSRCLVGEGLNHSSHSKGAHSKGTLLHDNVSDIALIGNLYISNDDRNPLFKGGVRAVMVNNVIHNPGQRALQFGQVESQWKGREIQRAALSIVGNVVRKGPSSAADMVLFEVWPATGNADVYLEDNLFFDVEGAPVAAMTGSRDSQKLRPGYTPGSTGGSGYEFLLRPDVLPPDVKRVEHPPLWPPRLKARPVEDVQEWVLAGVGARPWDRDAVDLRLVDEVRKGAGKIIDREPTAFRE